MTYRSRNQGVAFAFLKGKAAMSHNHNFHTDGVILASYETPIARRIRLENGQIAILGLSTKLTLTTEGIHKHALSRAWTFYARDDIEGLFWVPNIEPHSHADHQENLLGLLKGYEEVLDAARRGKSWIFGGLQAMPQTSRETYKGQHFEVWCYSLVGLRERLRTMLLAHLKDAEEYAKVFDVKPDHRVDVEQAITATMETVWARAERYYHPLKVKRRETEYAKRLLLDL